MCGSQWSNGKMVCKPIFKKIGSLSLFLSLSLWLLSAILYKNLTVISVIFTVIREKDLHGFEFIWLLVWFFYFFILKRNIVLPVVAPQQNWSDSSCLLFMKESCYLNFFFRQWLLMIKTFFVTNHINKKY